MEQHTKRPVDYVVEYGWTITEQQSNIYLTTNRLALAFYGLYIFGWGRQEQHHGWDYHTMLQLFSTHVMMIYEVITPSQALLICSIQPRNEGSAIILKSRRSLLKLGQTNDKLESYWKSWIPKISLEIFKIWNLIAWLLLSRLNQWSITRSIHYGGWKEVIAVPFVHREFITKWRRPR